MSLKSHILNNILDKINQSGLESLSQHEIKVLRGELTGDITKDIFPYLKPYKNLQSVNDRSTYFGKEQSDIIYFDKDEYFKLNTTKGILEINYNEILDNLYKIFEEHSEDEVHDAIIKWFEETYNVSNIKSITPWFEEL